MGLLNYTTNIDPDKTALEIAKCLSSHGASGVLTEYDPTENYLVSISFRIKLNDNQISFRLPCDWKPVLEIMYKDKPNPFTDEKKHDQLENTRRAQAVRTAWRIIKDWVEAQMALVETQMARTEEVFLPYAIMKDGRTLAEHIETNPGFLLGNGN
jgi:hypothetical protein